ncbi:MAG: endolytic transglycosylase MltG [Anaerolineaceae bacterium]|nr:endolytic transglycosylase MltG [Anaerolineaceae bacterium]
MGRTIRLIILGIFVLGFATLIVSGVVFILWGDDIVDFAQVALARITLSTRENDLLLPAGADDTPVRFVVELGDTPKVIADRLASWALIRDEQLFVDYLRANDLDTQIEAGTYFLYQTQTIPQIALALTDSGSSQFPFRILEGWRLEEIAAAIDDNPYFPFSGADFLAVVGPGAAIDPDFAAYAGLPVGASLEGFLFPDTYQLPAVITPVMLRDILTQTFRERVGTQLVADGAADGFSLYDIVTLASIVQREAIHPDEHPLIASVYRNRLANGIKLDADPTIQYAIGYRDGRWWPGISAAEYTSVVSTYNTYLNYGLPPGPISNPGLSAIRAAAYPAESSYFYFRADCSPDGYHTFSTTYEEHLGNGC